MERIASFALLVLVAGCGGDAASVVEPDAAPATADAAAAGFDAAEETPDATPPAPDATPPAPDATPPAPDATPPAPDATPPAPDAGPPPITASAYELTSSIDLTAAAVLPASSYLTVLQGLRDDPADTLITLLDQAGVPLIDDLLAILPSILEDRVKDAIDDYIDSAVWGNILVTDELDWILDHATLVLARFELVTGLALPAGDAAGHSVATHALRAIKLGDVELAISSVPPPLVGQTSVAAWVTTGPGADAHLALGDHSFGLPYGAYAFAALEDLLRARYGTDLRGTLGKLIDCPALAFYVADQCVFGVCVGHETELLDICEEGLDHATAQVRARFESIRFDAIRFEQGNASMWDAARVGAALDGRLDRIDGGVWKAWIDAGMGPRSAPATFTGLAEP